MRQRINTSLAALCAAVVVTVAFWMTETLRPSNRLSREKSPYLLQHAHNPVDWYPWGPEALEKAAREDKPIFLSIGYSTCYWCHVMERESFENPQIAQLLNQHFIAIKVDREERPDLDALYMTAVQALSGQGGWPMSVFLTPEGKPFFGGTYFPPHDKWGRPGFEKILRSIAAAWRTKRPELLASSHAITEALQAGTISTPGTLTLQAITMAAQQCGAQYDAAHGGFGPAPKFPRPHALSLLLRAWSRQPEAATLAMVETTLRAMARGGLHDQLGGGFHRYSTDAQWLVPHFEKMLYDQALLARAYLEAYQATGKADYADVARDIFAYVLRDLRAPEGAFYSAEDAGEVGKEGEFYVWTPAEVAAVLGPEEAAAFGRVYDVTDAGNFEGRSILRLLDPEGGRQLASAREKLLAARAKRIRPHRDDKILTDWNGLMIGALAYGSRALGDAEYAEAARRAARFLLDRLQRDGRLLHRYRDGEAKIEAFLDDYAFFAWGLLDVYEATGEPEWLREAVRLGRQMLSECWDEARGGFFLSGRRNESLIAKTKELYDGAVPSGNSVAALVLSRLALMTGDAAFERRAEQCFQAFAGQVDQAPHAFPQFLIALDLWLGPSKEVVIAGEPDDPAARRMIELIHRTFLPRAVLLVHSSRPPASGDIEALSPFVAAQRPLEGRATAYVCERRVCQLPTTELEQLERLLK